MPDFIAWVTPFINVGIALLMVKSYVALERRLQKLEITQEMLIEKLNELK